MNLMFISHASQDRVIAKTFRDDLLHGGMGISPNDIVLTSLSGSHIPSGLEWREYLKRSLLAAKIIVLIVTPNYRESEICLNEAGAAWISNAYLVIPCYIGAYDVPDNVGIIFNVKQAIDLQNPSRLDELQEQITSILGITGHDIVRWNERKHDFLKRLNEHVSKYPAAPALTRAAFDGLRSELKSKQSEITNLTEALAQCENVLKEVKALKNKEEVRRIEIRSNGDQETFNNLVSDAKKLLRAFSPYVNGLLYSAFTGRPYYQNVENIVRERVHAESRELINSKGALNFDSIAVSRAWEALQALDGFLKHETSRQFREQLQETHGFWRLQNVDFWKRVLKVMVG